MFLGEEAKPILAALQQGSLVRTRYRERPHEIDVEKTTSLYGFAEALEFLFWMIDRVR